MYLCIYIYIYLSLFLWQFDNKFQQLRFESIVLIILVEFEFSGI